MKQNTVVIGLTGQTGAGKSTVGESLLRRGAAWVDADLIAHDVADNEKVCLADLALEFTIDILNVDGTLNRKKLADIVFHDKAKLRRWATFPRRLRQQSQLSAKYQYCGAKPIPLLRRALSLCRLRFAKLLL